MFGIFKRTSKQTAEISLKTFEVYKMEKVVGMFITQNRATCIGTIAARTKEEADLQAKIMGGYAVHPMNHQG